MVGGSGSKTKKCVGAVCLAILGVVGLILLIFGCLLPGLANSAYKSGISSLLVVDDGIQLEQYNQWVANGTLDESASKYDYYIPSLTNLADVMTKGAAPIFEDKGKTKGRLIRGRGVLRSQMGGV